MRRAAEGPLLHGDRLCEVAGLTHLRAHEHGGVIGEQLDRNARKDRCNEAVDVRQLDTGHYRRQLGMVLQDPYLFHGTVLENIRYGDNEALLGEGYAAA